MSVGIEDRPEVAEGLARELQGNMRGRVIAPTDSEYDQARAVYNRMIDRYPQMIARCSGVADVIACVKFARRHGLLVSVRGGGHSVSGKAVCDGGLVIDLSEMNAVRVDPVRRTARAEGGATWRDFDHETFVFGLATTGGAISTTGIAGLTLGGGIGWLMRKHGLSCDNLLSVELVTAEGELVTASETENPELFWAIRGAGSNFGVVTSFEYRLHPIPDQILAGPLLYSGDKAADLLRFYGEFSETEPDAMVSFMIFFNAPPWAALPQRLYGQPMVGIAVAYSGPFEEAKKAFKPLRETVRPEVDLIAPTRYPVLQSASDDDWRPGLLNYWKPEFLGSMSHDLAETIADHVGRFVQPVLDAPDAVSAQPINCIEIGHMGGAVSRVPEESTAFSHRDADYLVNITAVWTDPAETDRLVSWTRDFSQALQPFAAGPYVNYFSDDGEDRLRAAYGPEKYERLGEIKAKYDPTNFFIHTQNIKPKTT